MGLEQPQKTAPTCDYSLSAWIGQKFRLIEHQNDLFKQFKRSQTGEVRPTERCPESGGSPPILSLLKLGSLAARHKSAWCLPLTQLHSTHLTASHLTVVVHCRILLTCCQAIIGIRELGEISTPGPTCRCLARSLMASSLTCNDAQPSFSKWGMGI